MKTGQLLPKALGCALIRCALSLLILVSTTACGALGVSIERTPMPERTASAVTTTSEPTYLARQTPAQASATPIGTTAPEEPTDQATARPTPKPGTEAQDEIPDRCRVEGHELYVNTENGYCFSYPPGFTPGEFSPGQPAIFGPPLDQSIEPLAAMLGIEVKPVPAGSDLSDLVDVFVAEFANLPLPSITRSPFELGGEPAA